MKTKLAYCQNCFISGPTELVKLSKLPALSLCKKCNTPAVMRKFSEMDAKISQAMPALRKLARRVR